MFCQVHFCKIYVLKAEVDFAMGLFEQSVKIEDVFTQDEMIDVIGATKGTLVKATIGEKLTRKSNANCRPSNIVC